MKRILIFSTAYFPLVGGAEVAVKEITDRLPDYSFVLITARLDSRFSAIEKMGNVEVHRYGVGDASDKVHLAWSGARYAETLGEFDAVWSIMASYAGFAALRYKKRNPTVPYLLTLQEGDSRWQIYKHVWWCWWYFKQIFTKADRIQAISAYLASWAKSLGAKCPIDVVPNGVDLPKFTRPSSVAAVRQEIRNRVGVPVEASMVFTASRLVKKNGIADLVESLKFLSTNTHLVIAGEGVLKESLQAQAQKFSLTNRVHFIGTLNHAELPKYLWASDIFCRPSLSEGLGNSFLEAMAAGVPIVGTLVGGIKDFLLDGVTGLACQPNDPKSIAAQIDLALADKSLYEQVQRGALALIEKKYSWSVVVSQMKNIFDSVCAS